MAKVRHQGGAVAEVDDSLVEGLLVSGEWEVVGAEKPAAPVRRPRKAAPKVEEAVTEE